MSGFTAVQVPGLVLPTVAPLGTETENVNDILEHTSLEFRIDYMQEKQIHILATEIVIAGLPGNLLCWIELSPYPTANSLEWMIPLPVTGAFWAAIGGGGGTLAPVAPHVEVGTGVNLTMHRILLPWAIHSGWGRLVVQTPVLGAAATWLVQAMFSAKTG